MTSHQSSTKLIASFLVIIAIAVTLVYPGAGSLSLKPVTTDVPLALTLVTHLFVHKDIEHLLVNLLGLLATLVIWPAFGGIRRSSAMVLVAATAAGSYFVATGPVYGLSGVLHALFAYLAIKRGLEDSKGVAHFKALLVFGIAVKLYLESNGAAALGVAWMMHVAGAVVGVALALLDPLLLRVVAAATRQWQRERKLWGCLVRALVADFERN